MKNLKFILRRIKDQKLFAIINLTGLTIGIIAASLIIIYISFELGFDKFNINADSIFRVYGTYNMQGKTQGWITTPAPLASFLKDKFPEIINTVRIRKIPKGLFSSGDKNFFEEKVIMADTSIFKVFTYPLLIGNPDIVLSQPNSIVLSKTMANKYFGNHDPIGKTIRYNRGIDLTVSGIMEDIPQNSHLIFDMVVSMSGARVFFGEDFLRNRMNTVTALYLLVNPNTDENLLGAQISKSTKEYDEGADFGDNKQYHIQSLSSIHLHSNMGGELSVNNEIKNVYILGTIALLILIIACINYLNLTFSINSHRYKELGMRKIMGAKRRQLLCLFIIDASILVGLSVLFSSAAIEDLLFWFGKVVSVNFSDWFSFLKMIPGLMLLFLIITSIIGLTSGWISSRINPMDSLKPPSVALQQIMKPSGILILFQFGISIALISSTLLINKQIQFIRNTNLGFSKDQLLIIPLNDNNVLSKIQTLKSELIANPNVLSVSAISDLPGQMKWVTSIDYEGSNSRIPETMTYLDIDKDFFKTFGIQLQDGFMPGDSACPYSGTKYFLNESAVKKLGWEEPIGKHFSTYSMKEGFVTGTVKNFHFKSLYEKIEPLFLAVKEGNYQFLAVKLSKGNTQSSIDHIRKTWTGIAPDSPFEYFFYDNFYSQLYKKESQFNKLIIFFSIIAIIIACVGLFGLSAYFSEKRTKEIGVRKVNGATIKEIISLLNKDFLKWISLAFIISTPIAWFFMNKWLHSFAYKTKITWWIFALSGLISIIVALLTISWQSIRASQKNPVEALRYE
jgi:putative ABC transport system permease protein